MTKQAKSKQKILDKVGVTRGSLEGHQGVTRGRFPTTCGTYANMMKQAKSKQIRGHEGVIKGAGGLMGRWRRRGHY
eukprot:1030471-Prorocentrum_minimum.AAC.1